MSEEKKVKWSDRVDDPEKLSEAMVVDVLNLILSYYEGIEDDKDGSRRLALVYRMMAYGAAYLSVMGNKSAAEFAYLMADTREEMARVTSQSKSEEKKTEEDKEVAQ